MKALIPLKDGHEISTEVLRGLAGQSISLQPVFVSRPQRDDDPSRSLQKGQLSITECRNLLRDLALQNWPGDEYFLMMNRDVILRSDTVQSMLNFLSSNKEYGALCCWTRKPPMRNIKDSLHVDIACMLIRASSLSSIHFHNECGCNCAGLCIDFIKLGLKIEYLEDLILKEVTENV